jgi:tRNA nucleotidyltransferase (CCA-adding enzyme)
MLPPSTSPFTIILTHEHADFDALASLLAAARLYGQALPVLPRRMNRNLEAFLAVYRDVLPFVRLADLPRRSIDQVILVDTQTVQPVRGMGPHTTGLIIDHHPQMRELPDGWSFTGEEVGAATTLLVEQLAQRGTTITATDATLMLLGIYEDTGGLSFETTTPRDMRAGAWLLEHGANLLLVYKFLHHPLTDEQRGLYQQLTDSSQPYQFHGHSVIIATATVNETVEEISTLAHKLHDLYEPDAIFMLVRMADYIQLVARSTSDAIDVGKLAAALGGGGHSRAAAALIRDASLPSVLETLVYLLQSHVRPTVTVGQIMSYGVPQTLAPDETIADAAERMRRYGFEGFPVVEQGRIVGMLTRREIDRAMHHGLQRHPVSRYMRRGEVFVTPEDSVETLRHIMTEQDWGQVPVLEPHNGALLGIVTRTDLLKQWAGIGNTPAETLDQRMAATLSPALLDLLRQAGALAGELGFPLYAVGGFVRDLLMGHPNLDIDLVVEGDAIRLAQVLARRLGGHVRSHQRFGTAKWILPEALRTASNAALPESLDFATARTEFYERPTALPTVERSSIKQDLHRRDFTINTLAIRLTPDRWGELLDFYGGRKDVDEGLIRVLHSLSFVEDPTRILRAVRFEQRFSFAIEPRTEELIGNALDLLDRVSAERVRHELELILAEAEPERALGRLAEIGVLTVLHPDLRCDAWFHAKAAELRVQVAQVRNPDSQMPPSMTLTADALPRLYAVLLAFRMPDESLKAFSEKYHLRKSYRDLLQEVARLRGSLPRLGSNGMKPSEIVAILDETSDEARLFIRVATDSWLARQRLDQYQRRLRHVRPILTGDDLRQMGLPPGRLYSNVLDRLRTAHLDGEVETLADEKRLVERFQADGATAE